MPGLGLRTQILAALSGAFVVAFVLLGIAMVQLTTRARRLDREGFAASVAHSVGAAIDRLPRSRRDTADFASALVETQPIARIEVELAPGHESLAVGGGVTSLIGVANLESGGRVRVWLRPGGGSTNPLTNLLLLYVALTGGGILVLTYVALTYLIVRPVTALTDASERLASGRLSVHVPVSGAGEVARLARSFNAMAAQIRHDREALERRLVELENTTRELKDAQDQVIRSERLASVGRLSAGIAHEIGNPLAAVSGLVELLRDGDLAEPQQAEFLDRVLRETGRINGIIRDLLDFARLDRVDASSADLVVATEDAIKLVAPQKSFREVEIRRRFSSDVPRVRGSQEQLSQLVVNLLLNAADAMEASGVIDVTIERQDAGVELRVADSGPGIPEELRGELFEPFVTSKPAGQGTGLGLAVCHTIVQRAGGTIEAESLEDGGAVFRVLLSTNRQPES